MPETAELFILDTLLDGVRIPLTAFNVEGHYYVNPLYIYYALNSNFDINIIYEADIIRYYYEANNFFLITDIAQIAGIRLNWIETRQTLIMDTSVIILTADCESIFTNEPLPQHIRYLIRGSSFHDNTPFDYSHLAYLTITHANFQNQSQLGHMIVAASIAEEVLDIFQEIYDARFPIERMRLIDFYEAGDYLSMADNNSVGFNFRYIAGTRVISQHGLGRAIDINPIQNPYIRGATIWPAAGEAYLDRTDIRPGMIIPGDVVHQAFVSRGWTWGGMWTTPRDYHHFERR